MTVLGLGSHSRPSGEIRVGFRRGVVRSLVVTLGGAGLVSLAIGLINLSREQPTQMFDLLSKWGFVWIIALAGMFLAWDLAKVGLAHLAELVRSIQAGAVAMNRIADRDDRERDRLANEIGFVGRRVERLASDLTDHRDEQRRHNREIKELLSRRAAEQGGAGDGGA